MGGLRYVVNGICVLFIIVLIAFLLLRPGGVTAIRTVFYSQGQLAERYGKSNVKSTFRIVRLLIDSKRLTGCHLDNAFPVDRQQS